MINKEKETQLKKEDWRLKGERIWANMTPFQRNSCLIDVAPFNHLDDVARYMFVSFGELPEKYAEALARKWDILK